MSARKILLSGLVVSVMLAGGALPRVGKTEEKAEKGSRVIIGTFDSRAVKLAYDSATFAGRMPDLGVPKAIEFRQGFGTGDVSEYLDQIRDQIPKIAQKTGVDVIVSKWDIEYHDPNATFLDVTESLIQPFRPTEERMKIIRELREKPPLTEKEIREFEASGREL